MSVCNKHSIAKHYIIYYIYIYIIYVIYYVARQSISQASNSDAPLVCSIKHLKHQATECECFAGWLLKNMAAVV